MSSGYKEKQKPRSLKQLRRDRLQTRLKELEERLNFLELERPNERESSWRQSAMKSLEAASNAFEDKKDQLAWAHCNQTHRFILHGANHEELAAHSRALRWEAEEKLKNWRKAALLDVLRVDTQQQPGKEEVVLAQYLLDQHFENVYFKLEGLGTRVRQMMLVLAVVIVAVLAIPFLNGLICEGSDDIHDILRSVPKMIAVMVLGTVGATLSNVLTALGGKGRIPQFIQGSQEWSVRLCIGALSAVAVVLFVQSEILPIKSPEGLEIYPYALVAGFTDQLLNRVIRAIEQSIEQ